MSGCVSKIVLCRSEGLKSEAVLMVFDFWRLCRVDETDDEDAVTAETFCATFPAGADFSAAGTSGSLSWLFFVMIGRSLMAVSRVGNAFLGRTRVL